MKAGVFRTFLFIATSIIGLWFLSFLVIYGIVKFGFGDGLAESGLIGDTFGAINALFSGLALAGVLGALYLQNGEITDAAKNASKDAELTAISAQLTTLPELIKFEADHITTHHQYDIQGYSMHTSSVQTLVALLAQRRTEFEEAYGDQGIPAHQSCFLNNLDNLIKYRRRIVELYDRLEALISTP